MAKKEFKVLRGTYEVRGVIRGLDRQKESNKDNPSAVYTKKTKSDKTYRELSFNVESLKGESTRVRVKSYKLESVYGFNKEDKSIKQFPWANRNKLGDKYRSFNTIGYHNLESKKEDGSYNTEYSYSWDAIPELCKQFKDGDTVFIRGTWEHSDYGDKTYTAVDADRFYYGNAKIDFDSEEFDIDKYTPVRKFTQYVVFENTDEDDKGKHFIDTRIITNKDGDNTKVRFEVLPKFAKHFAKVPAGTEMYLIGDYYTIPKSEDIDISSHADNDDYGFTDEEGYAEDATSELGANGYDSKIIVKVVLTSDKDGNRYIKPNEYDIDELDEIKADIIAEREEKSSSNKKSSVNTKRNNKKEDKEDWSGIEGNESKVVDEDDWS